MCQPCHWFCSFFKCEITHRYTICLYFISLFNLTVKVVASTSRLLSPIIRMSVWEKQLLLFMNKNHPHTTPGSLCLFSRIGCLFQLPFHSPLMDSPSPCPYHLHPRLTQMSTWAALLKDVASKVEKGNRNSSGKETLFVQKYVPLNSCS